MVRMRWQKIVASLLAVSFSIPAEGDDLADLKNRLDAIERENAQLREDLYTV